MSACGTLHYTDFTQNVFNAIRQTVKSDYNIDVPDNPNDSISKDGFTIEWSIDYSTTNGTIDCTKSPWLVPCSVINSKINSIVTGCGGKAA